MSGRMGKVLVPGAGPVGICSACLRGEHPDNHMSMDMDHAGCKTTIGGEQCCCHPGWPELQEAVRLAANNKENSNERANNY